MAPLTLFAMYVLFLALVFGALTREFWSINFLLLLILAALGCGWKLALAFVSSGREALVALPAGLWVVPIAVAAFTLAGVLARIAKIPDAYDMVSELKLMANGWPACIPLLHLAFERWMRANIRFSGAQLQEVSRSHD